jgi:periplasmic divalent cation tolerance protein
MKTRKELYNEVEAEILKLHDYETCEILSYDIKQGNKHFLEWIDKETKL